MTDTDDQAAMEARWAKLPPKIRAALEAKGFFKLTKEERVAARERFLAELKCDGEPGELYRVLMDLRGRPVDDD